MAITQKISLESFVEVQNDLFFRRDDGKICISTPRNVIINCSRTDEVELISVTSVYENTGINTSDTINWYFWKVSNKIYPLTGCLSSQSFVEIPDDTIFVGFYVSNALAPNKSTIYVKYLASNNCYGILSFNTMSVSHIISYSNEYSEIEYENSYFYATSKKGRKRYHVFNSYGFLVNSYTTKRRLIRNSEFSYDKNKIYSTSISITFPGGIDSVYIENEGKFNFIVVRNKNGSYYYTMKLEYILGPIVYDFIQVQENFCYVAEMLNKKFTKIFCIKYLNKNKYICSSIESKNGIKYHSFQNVNFFMKNGSLYVLRLESMEFEFLFEENEADSFTFSENNFKDCIDIVCFKNSIPICMAIYDLTCNTIVSRNNLEVIGESYDKSIFVCQLQVLNSPIFGINKEGKLIFSV